MKAARSLFTATVAVLTALSLSAPSARAEDGDFGDLFIALTCGVGLVSAKGSGNPREAARILEICGESMQERELNKARRMASERQEPEEGGFEGVTPDGAGYTGIGDPGPQICEEPPPAAVEASGGGFTGITPNGAGYSGYSE
jgi:hypothetical protein